MAKTNLTAARLRELLDYNPETGVFTWRRGHQRIRIGDTAGTHDSHGHRQIQIDGRLHLAHRLVWLHLHGTWPEDQIDHVNGNRDDNRMVNLRVVTSAGNSQNKRHAAVSNLSGFLGVSRRNDGWQAQIGAGGKKHYLGVYATQELAHQAYLDAKRELHSTCTI